MGQVIDLAEYRRTHGPAMRCLVAWRDCCWSWWSLALMLSGIHGSK